MPAVFVHSLSGDNCASHGSCLKHLIRPAKDPTPSKHRASRFINSHESKGIAPVFVFFNHCPACRTTLIATRFWVVMICPIIKCLTVLEFSFILFDLCLFITIFNFILNYVPIVTFWILTYHKSWILLIIFCFIWSYWFIYFLTCLEVFWSVVS